MEEIAVSAPGRITLFGDDYIDLHYPTIIGTIDIRTTIKGRLLKKKVIVIESSDIGSRDAFSLFTKLPYTKNYDILRSCVNILLTEGISFERGSRCKVSSQLPIASGFASSSALSVAWMRYLSECTDKALTPQQVALLAHKAEILEFKQKYRLPDHLAITQGGLMYYNTLKEPEIHTLKANIPTLIIGDSGNRYGTTQKWKYLLRVVKRIERRIQKKSHNFSISTTNFDEVTRLTSKLPQKSKRILNGILEMRKLTQEASKLFAHQHIKEETFGELIERAYWIQKNEMRVSTKKIEKMITQVKQVGAIACKYLTLGRGICFLVFAPGYESEVAKKIKRMTGIPYITNIGGGVDINGNH